MSDNVNAETQTPAELSGFDPATAEKEPAPADTATPSDNGTAPAETDSAPVDDTEGDNTDPTKVIKSLRQEAARNRVAAREAREEALAARAAAEAASRQAVEERESIGRALAEAFGVTPKAEDTPPDPVELATQAQAQAQAAEEAAQQATSRERAARVELALYRAAGRVGADADALLDSRSFLGNVGELDPTAADFSAQVEDVVSKAVESNARFRKEKPKAAGRSGADLSAGNAEPSSSVAGMSIAELIKARRKNRGFGA